MKISSLAVAALVVLLAGCSSDPGRPSPSSQLPIDPNDPLAARREEAREARLGARDMYRRARESLNSSDFSTAVEDYDKLTTRYPFSDYSTQGELERIYALYRNFEPDRALSAADKFMREHPRHASIDYVQYIKGLTNYNRDFEALSLLPVDETKSDVTSQRRAYDDFATLLQKFPKSRYAGDAYQRMVFLRNRLAEHELHVVDFYVRRGAYVAAAKRAEQVIGQYPGTLASHRALAMLQECYEKAGLKDQAADARRLLAAQPPLPDNLTPSATVPWAAQAPSPPAAETEKKPGVMARVVKALSVFDNSESGYEVVIPTGDKPPADGAADKAATASAGTSAGPSGNGVAADAEAAASAKTGTSRGLSITMEPYDSEPPAPPAGPAEEAPAAAAPQP